MKTYQNLSGYDILSSKIVSKYIMQIKARSERRGFLSLETALHTLSLMSCNVLCPIAYHASAVLEPTPWIFVNKFIICIFSLFFTLSSLLNEPFSTISQILSPNFLPTPGIELTSSNVQMGFLCDLTALTA